MAELGRDVLVSGLGGLGKSPVTLKHAYLSLSVAGKGLGSIDLVAEYPHLQVLDLSNNQVVDLSCLAALPHLHVLSAAQNKVTKVLAFEPNPLEDNFADHEFRVAVGSSLHDVDLSENAIEEIDDLSRHRFLRKLLLDSNSISRISGVGSLEHLQVLSLSRNNISAISGLDRLPLKFLDLSYNHIQRLENLGTLVQLQSLIVAHNEIESLSGLQRCKALNMVDMSFNRVSEIHEVHHLAGLPLLSRLDLSGNDVSDAEHFRLRVLVYTENRLEYLNGLLASPKEKVKGANLFGADLEHRRDVHESLVEEEPFVNYMPPFEDDEEKKREVLALAADEYNDAAAAEYMDELIDESVGGGAQLRRASDLVDTIMSDTLDRITADTATRLVPDA